MMAAGEGRPALPPIPGQLQIFAVPLPGEVTPGTNLAGQLLAALARLDQPLLDGDVVVVAQKVVSKAEGRLVRLDEIEPSAFAIQVATAANKDPRVVELVLRESVRIVRMDRGILITETRHGFVCANAGVDLSNVSGGDVACLLPLDPDRSAALLRQHLLELTGRAVAVIVSDTFGRPWRHGLTNVALGVAGLSPVLSYAGASDLHGYHLRVSDMAVADELAAAAELVMGKTSQRPFAIIRGYPARGEGTGRDLVRPAEADLFR